MFRLACCLLVATLAQAAEPVFQTSFEKPNQDWTVVRGSTVADSAVLHEGHKSLRVERDAANPDACVPCAP